jgi:polyisoprenoid-binding protein YceI
MTRHLQLADGSATPLRKVKTMQAAQRGLAPLKFTIDQASSRFTVQAFATGMLSSFGHNPTISIRDFDGELSFVPESYEKAQLRMTFKTTSLEVLDEMKRDDRRQLEQAMNGEVLEVERFPTADYYSKEITVQKPSSGPLNVHIDGNLTFHGVTRRQVLDARVAEMGTTLRISGEFSLRQSDYGIKPFSFGGGMLRLKDELKFKFELKSQKPEELEGPDGDEQSQSQ